VQLVDGTNVLDLAIGGQVRRDEDGQWHKAAEVATYSSASPSSSSSLLSTQSTSGAAESEALKRLMQRRERE
jgi:hypothetical protein